MPEGGVIRIAAKNVQVDERTLLPLAAGRYVKISIADHGPGISPHLVEQIFDPYFTTKTTSSGLGLAICHSIIRKHNGSLHLDKNSPAGASFAFFLPSASPRGSALNAQEARERILVMDDEAAIRELTSDLLTTLGYEPSAAPDGSEAVRLYEHAVQQGETFRAVILDATVRGGLGGVETIARLRHIDPQVNAIICSGYSDEAALSEFLSYGFRAALPKPFTRQELAQALQRTLESDNARLTMA